VPLLYKRPFGMPRGRIDGLVSTLDIYPTIFDWLGFEIAHPHRGVSLRPLMEQGMDSKREAVFSHHAHDYQVSVRTRDQRATLGLQDMVFGKQGAGYSISKDRMEVYDYSDPVAGRETVGPQEGREVATENPALAQRYRLQLEAFLADRYSHETDSMEDDEYIERLEALGYVR